MAIISTLDFEDFAESASVSPGAPWSTNGTTAVASAAASAHGVRGARWASTATAGRVQYDAGSDQVAARVLSWYMNIRAYSSTNHYIASVRSLTTGGASQGDVRINPDRTVTLRNAAQSAVATSSQTLAQNTLYRFEWRVNQGSGIQELRVYQGEATAPHLTISGAWTGANTRVFSFGPHAAAADGALDYDTVRFADDWTGPFAVSSPATNTHYYVTPSRELRPFRLVRPGFTIDPDPPDTQYSFWISHYDTQLRSGAPANSNPAFDAFEWSMKDRMSNPPTGPIGSFIRGYSGTNFPSTFQASSVSSAPSRGVGAMLNVKRPDWGALASGAYDGTIQSFFNSWPVETFGSFTINHEPENDGPSPATPSNHDYVAWASVNGPLWCQGIARTIAVAAPIIRSRGLDVKLGGCLMDFSWDTTRWQYWDWWNYVDPQYFDVVEFQIDAYTKTVDSDPPRHYNLLPRLVECMNHGRSVGIEHFSLFETANDRRLRNGGDTIVGNDESVAVFWEEYFSALQQQIPETRMVAYFSIPTGPASAQAGIMGRGLEVFAEGCLNGLRP